MKHLFPITLLALLFAGCNTLDANYPGSSSGCSDKDPDDISLYECGKTDNEEVDPNIKKILPEDE